MRAPVAQLDRAMVFGTIGWGFKSLRAYFIVSHVPAPSSASPQSLRSFRRYLRFRARPYGGLLHRFLQPVPMLGEVVLGNMQVVIHSHSVN
jgi:hypothetical protein